FSSRRRHTRWPRDWSSDVCSSDLQLFAYHSGAEQLDGCNGLWVLETRKIAGVLTKKRGADDSPKNLCIPGLGKIRHNMHCCWPKIGRASCRERLLAAVVGSAVHKK